MRVISGKVRGLKLNSPPGNDTRPTLDRVKEAVFSMLLPYLNGANVLDLFAGSGSLGIEALSRGGYAAHFIDVSDTAIECVKKNIEASNFNSSATIIKSTAENFLRHTKEKFDIIFLDPPYAEDLYTNVIHLIEEYEILSKNGLLVIEWDYETGFSNEIGSFEILKEKRYGRVGITVLKWGSSQ